jgi:hypothetical protein
VFGILSVCPITGVGVAVGIGVGSAVGSAPHLTLPLVLTGVGSGTDVVIAILAFMLKSGVELTSVCTATGTDTVWRLSASRRKSQRPPRNTLKIKAAQINKTIRVKRIANGRLTASVDCRYSSITDLLFLDRLNQLRHLILYIPLIYSHYKAVYLQKQFIILYQALAF